ncbi:MAG TPA: dihydroorotase [Terriglobales bacterium]|nr:dihydroorotase [Terriglobales bacterium]
MTPVVQMTKRVARKTSSSEGANSLLIRGGHVIDPASDLDDLVDVLLRDGKVAAINPSRNLQQSAGEVFEARGLIVAPGFIDLHVHLRQPGQDYKETIATGTAAAAAGGFTAVCAMPNTVPVNDSPEITSWMQEPGRDAIVTVFPVAAATVESKGERLTNYAALRQAGAVAVSDDGHPVLADNIMEMALREARRVDFPVIQHAEDTRLSTGGVMNAGVVAFRLGLRGISNRSEWSIVERDIELARQTDGHVHVAHLSTAEAMDAVRRGKRQGIHVTCEVTPHHFTLIDEDVGDYDTRFKMNPPLRSRADRDALIPGLRDGIIDAIATDHAPHAMHEKEVEFERSAFGITGLETALALAITQLYVPGHVSLKRIVELLSTNPARILGCRDRGSLEEGARADLTLFDPRKRWTFEAARSRSKSRNSPFDGWKLTGMAVATIVGGKVVYRVDD